MTMTMSDCLRAAHDAREDVAADLVLAERVLAELTGGNRLSVGDRRC